jgi:hypothetical protein
MICISNDKNRQIEYLPSYVLAMLPTDVLTVIFALLPLDAWRLVRLVCRQWNLAAQRQRRDKLLVYIEYDDQHIPSWSRHLILHNINIKQICQLDTTSLVHLFCKELPNVTSAYILSRLIQKRVNISSLALYLDCNESSNVLRMMVDHIPSSLRLLTLSYEYEGSEPGEGDDPIHQLIDNLSDEMEKLDLLYPMSNAAIPHLYRLQQLKELALHSQFLFSPDLSPLVNLTELFLYCNIVDAAGLAGLNLTLLNLSVNRIDNIDRLGTMTTLETLVLAQCVIGDNGAQFLQQLVPAYRLTYLDLSDNQLGFDTLAIITQMSQLVHLNLCRNDLRGYTHGVIRPLINLQYLAISETSIDSMAFYELDLPRALKLHYLDISFLSLVVQSLTKITSITTLICNGHGHAWFPRSPSYILYASHLRLKRLITDYTLGIYKVLEGMPTLEILNDEVHGYWNILRWAAAMEEEKTGFTDLCLETLFTE